MVFNAEDVLDMDNYSIDQLDKFFSDHKCEVHIMRFDYSSEWHVIIRKNDDGTKIEINTNHERLYAALYDAYERFNKIAKKGIPTLLAPQLEHKPVKLDDDIPF